MEGIQLNLDVRGIEPLIRKIDGISKRTADQSKACAVASMVMYQDVMKHFQEERGPDGKWQALSIVTLRRRRGKQAKILQDTGTLRTSIGPSSDRNMARVGTNIIYASKHQFGEKVPKREFLWLSKEARERIIKNYWNWNRA